MGTWGVLSAPSPAQNRRGVRSHSATNKGVQKKKSRRGANVGAAGNPGVGIRTIRGVSVASKKTKERLDRGGGKSSYEKKRRIGQTKRNKNKGGSQRSINSGKRNIKLVTNGRGF